jgi:hypothetical protein
VARTRTAVGALLAAGILLLATGCAGRTAIGGVDVGVGGAVGSGVATDSVGGAGLGSDCRSTGGPAPTNPVLSPLSANAVLVGATRCLFEAQLVAGDGEWEVKLEQRADAGLDVLAAALRLPDQPAAASQACSAIGYVPIIITVTDQHGHQMMPRLPEADCGGPLKAATDAIAALNWSTVKTTKAYQTRTELEISSGCPGQYKHMITIVAIDQARAPGGPLAAPQYLPSAPLQVCRYALDPSSAVTLGGSALIQMGKLAAASTLDGKLAADLLAAVAAAPAAQPCGRPQAPFALLFTKGAAGPNISVELGGCYRALIDSDSSQLRQLDAQAVSALTA